MGPHANYKLNALLAWLLVRVVPSSNSYIHDKKDRSKYCLEKKKEDFMIQYGDVSNDPKKKHLLSRITKD